MVNPEAEAAPDLEAEAKQKAKEEYTKKYCNQPGPFQKSGLLGLLLFNWVTPMVDIAYKLGEFEQSMHYDLRPEDQSNEVCNLFEKNWSVVYPNGFLPPGQKTAASGFFKVIWMTFRWKLLLGVIVSVISSSVQYINSFIIYKAIQQVSATSSTSEGPIPANPNETIRERFEKYQDVGYYLLVLVGSKIIMGMVDSAIWFQLSLLGYKIRNVLNLFVFKKVQKKSMERDNTFSMGEITNLTQVDTGKFTSLSSIGGKIVTIPLEVGIGAWLLYKIMGKAVLPAFGIMLVTLAINTYLGKRYKKFQLLTMDVKDRRGKLINETFNNIRYIKMTGLETLFLKRVTNLKAEELGFVRKNFNRMFVSNIVNSMGPFLFMTTIYSFHLYWTGKLALEDAFVSSIIFGIFSGSFRFLAFLVIYCLDIVISARRLSFFLLSEEIPKQILDSIQGTKRAADTEGPKPVSVSIKNGNFYWVDKVTQKFYKEEKDRVSDKKNQDKLKGIKNAAEPDATKSRSATGLSSFKESRKVSTMSKGSFLENSLKASILDGEDKDDPNNPVEQKRYDLNLKNINLTLERGACVAVIGKVGSGKSSLLSALIGDLYSEDGASVVLDGTVAYVNQKPWISSKSIKENVVFGSEFEEGRLADALKYSCLDADLKSMEKGVDTMLGDRGINLSGGQKMRLSIARALYADKDIYLFDDPISALDIHVGKSVMEEAILGYLKGRTRIVTTHALSYLPCFDYIYILDEGEIIDQGTYSYMQTSETFQEIMKSITDAGSKPKGPETKPAGGGPGKKGGPGGKPAGGRPGPSKQELVPPEQPALLKNLSKEEKAQSKLIQDIISSEDKSKGAVDHALIWKYIELSGGSWRMILLFIFMSIWMCFSFGTNYFLQYWTTEHDDPRDIKTFILMFVLLNLGVTVTDFLRMFTVMTGNLRLSKELNFLMTFRLMHASVNKFFDRVPIGRILNRFLRDSDTVDMMLAWGISFMVQAVFMCTVDLGAMVFTSSPVIIPFFAFYVWMGFRLQRRYQSLLRDLTRLRSISSSPMIQSFSEAVSGNATIRAYGRYSYLEKEYSKYLDEFQKNSVNNDAASQWFSLRLTLMSNLVVIPSLLLAVFVMGTSPGKFALLLRYILFTVGDIDNLLSSYSNFENRLVSLERCTYFTNVIPEVGYKKLPELESKIREGFIPKIARNQAWPSTGSLTLTSLKVKYRADLPEVLKGISLTVPHGTKVGIVGRTGAGKSTLVSCLYRNFDEYEGDIVYSGREIRQVDLKVLRSNITIIPQDPYIFQNSLRANMDPLEELTDEEIQDVLQEVGLWPKFERDKGLDTEIQQGGTNMSQGEKQLLCLARALLSKNKMVIMDEATANIDSQTEVIIQRLLKERFTDCTIFMIAHRLNTIMHCDKILVLEGGLVLEYGDLEVLKNDPSSKFHEMLSKAEELAQNLS